MTMTDGRRGGAGLTSVMLTALVCLLAVVCHTEAAGNEVASVSKEEQHKLLDIKRMECELFMLRNASTYVDNSHCQIEWDLLSCWPPTKAGTVAVKPCPDYINNFKLDQNATRTCMPDGTWYVNPEINATWTNFTQCISDRGKEGPSELMKLHMGRIILMFNINYGISLGSLVLAVVIMICFKRLHCPRNTIHLNLFGSFILRASMSFMKENLLVKGLGFPSDVIETPDGGVEFKQNSSHWECRLFFTIFNYALGANYIWIFIEALYLHMLISVAVFSERTGIKFYIICGWAAPLSFVIPWAIVRATKENIFCWNTHPKEAYFWIMRGPITLSIVVNFVLFLNILRVLFTKLNAVNSPEAKKFRYRKLAKSTLVLIPLFGVHYIVFPFLPSKVDEKTELVKLYFEMFFNSIQGFFVALLFCFMNGEVQGEIRKTWVRFRLTHQSSFRESYRGRSGANSTFATYISRARESIGSFQHVAGTDLRGKPDGRASGGGGGGGSSFRKVLVDETPLNSLSDTLAERQPLTNGRDFHLKALEPVPPVVSNGSSSKEDGNGSLIQGDCL